MPWKSPTPWSTCTTGWPGLRSRSPEKKASRCWTLASGSAARPRPKSSLSVTASHRAAGKTTPSSAGTRAA